MINYFTDRFFLIVFIRCWRRWRNYVPVWGQPKTLIFLILCYSFLFLCVYLTSISKKKMVTLLLWSAEWIEFCELWFPEVCWFKSKATQRRWTSVLFSIPEWYNWYGEFSSPCSLLLRLTMKKGYKLLLWVIVAIISVDNCRAKTTTETLTRSQIY